MHPFGGTPICPRCSKSVYAAEQVMGPGRKLYHKPCLSCMICRKRLDSYTLVEHDQEPYCTLCYTKNFSTRDLRQGNLPHRGSLNLINSTSPPGTTAPLPRVGSPISRTNTGTSNPLPYLKPTHSLRTNTSPTSTSSPPSINSSLQSVEESKPLDVNDVRTLEGNPPTEPTTPTSEEKAPSPPTLPIRPTHQPAKSLGSLSNMSNSSANPKQFSIPSFSTFGRTNNATSTALSLLEKEGINPLIPTTTGSRYGAALGKSSSVNTTNAPPRKWGGDAPLCPKCQQRVYFAEQVKAVGKTWHKRCLRCSECNTLLDSNRLRDHDNEPFCVRCYSKLHGPQGNGYALLGSAAG